jgi:hypothetical protein
MIKCTSQGCRKTASRQKTAGTPLEQGYRWTWSAGWRCPDHVETSTAIREDQA